MNPTEVHSNWQFYAFVVFCFLQAYTIWQQSRNHTLMNSRLTELQAVTRSSAHAEGVLQGTRAEQERLKLKFPGVVDKPVMPDERLEEIRGQT